MTLRHALEWLEEVGARYPVVSWAQHAVLAALVVVVALALPSPFRGLVIGAGCYLFRELDQVRWGRWTLDNVMDVAAAGLAGGLVDWWVAA